MKNKHENPSKWHIDFKSLLIGVLISSLVFSATAVSAQSIEALFNSVKIVVGDKVAAEIDKSFALSNGTEVPYSILYEGTTYLPLRKIGELLNKGILWDNGTRTVTLYDKDDNAKYQYEEAAAMNTYEKYITGGKNLQNTYTKLKNDKKLKIAYFGGSVTVGSGASDPEKYSWRGRVNTWFTESFPDAEISQIYAPIGATGSRLGAFRLERDVISYSPDLLFIEFSINDNYCRESSETASAQMEYIIRTVKEKLPSCDIVTILTTDKGGAQSGAEYPPMQLAHKNISVKYNVPVINAGKSLADSLGKLISDDTWNTYFNDIAHPKDNGYEKLYLPIEEFLIKNLFGTKLTAQLNTPDVLPESSTIFTPAKFYPASESMLSGTKGYKYSGDTFINTQNPYQGYIYTTETDNEFTYTFTGTELSLLIVYPGGNLKYSVDGGEYKTVSSQNSPMTIVSGLENKEHTIKITAALDSTKTMFKFGGIYVR